jgi:hypothetical protein
MVLAVLAMSGLSHLLIPEYWQVLDRFAVQVFIVARLLAWWLQVWLAPGWIEPHEVVCRLVLALESLEPGFELLEKVWWLELALESLEPGFKPLEVVRQLVLEPVLGLESLEVPVVVLVL